MWPIALRWAISPAMLCLCKLWYQTRSDRTGRFGVLQTSFGITSGFQLSTNFSYGGDGFWAAVFFVATMIVFRQLLVPGFVCWLFGSIVFYATQIDCTAARRSRSRAALGVATLLFLGALSLSRMPQLSLHSSIVDIGISGCFALLLFAVLKSSGAYPQWLAPLCRYGARSSPLRCSLSAGRTSCGIVRNTIAPASPVKWSHVDVCGDRSSRHPLRPLRIHCNGSTHI